MLRWLGKRTRVLTVLALLCPGAANAASHGAPATVPLGAVADAPAGFVDLCARDRVLCRAGNDEPGSPMPDPAPAPEPAMPVIGAPLAAMPIGFGTAALVRARSVRRAPEADAPSAPPVDDAGRLALLRRINAAVNAQVVQLPDSVTAGVGELWSRPGEVGRPAGDCEDIAIEKRARLLEAGFDPRRLFFAVVYRTGFGLHTLLVARLDGGDQVLDSAAARVQPWNRTHYVWLRAQTPGDPLRWARVALSGRPGARDPALS